MMQQETKEYESSSKLQQKTTKTNEFYHLVPKLSTSTDNENRGAKLVVKSTV